MAKFYTVYFAVLSPFYDEHFFKVDAVNKDKAVAKAKKQLLSKGIFSSNILWSTCVLSY